MPICTTLLTGKRPGREILMIVDRQEVNMIGITTEEEGRRILGLEIIVRKDDIIDIILTKENGIGVGEVLMRKETEKGQVVIITHPQVIIRGQSHLRHCHHHCSNLTNPVIILRPNSTNLSPFWKNGPI